MTDTTTLAPTDAELVALAEDFDVGYMSRGRLLVGTNPDCDFTDEVLAFARTVLAKWGAPAPVAEDAEDGARFRAMVNAALNEDAFEQAMYAAANAEPKTLDDFRALVDKARAQAAQPEGGAK